MSGRPSDQLDPALAAAIVDAAPIIVLMLDPAGRIVYANPVLEALTGRPLAALQGVDWIATFVPERDREHVARVFAAIVRGDPGRPDVNAIVSAGGTERDVEWEPRLLRSADDEVTGVLFVGKDVTDRPNDAELRRSRELLREAQAIARLGSWERDLTTGRQVWSDEVFGIYGVERDGFEPCADAFRAQVHPDDRAVVEEAYARSLELGEPYDVVHRLIMADGTVKRVRERGRTHRDGRGRPTRSIGTVQDITEQRRHEEELRIHSKVLMSMAEAVCFIDGEGKICFTNPALDAMWGYDAGELIGLHVTMLNDANADENAEIAAALIDALSREGYWEGEFRNRDKSGEVFYTRARISPIDHAGTPLWVSVQEDITEQRRTDAQLRKSLREKETLIREVHHRVKNNLQIISGLLHFHAKRVDDADQRAAFDEGRKRLLAMTLVHERLYQSEDLLRVDLCNYIRSLVNALADTFEDRKHVQVNMTLDCETLPIETALPCGMIVCELVMNAFKYAFPNGRRGGVSLRIEIEGNTVRMTVADDGVGLPAGFDPKTVGSFGWQLVRRLTAQIDGTVDVELGAVAGTEVRVSFPRPHDQSAGHAAADTASDSSAMRTIYPRSRSSRDK